MRLLTLRREGAERVGALAGDGRTVVDLASASRARDGRSAPGTGSLLELLHAGPTAIDDAAGLVEWASAAEARPPGVTVALADVELLAPLPRPLSLRDAMTFEKHVINSFRAGTLRRLAPVDVLLERALGGRRSLTHLLARGFYAQPPYYNASTAVVGSGATVRIPQYCEVFDYELEWAVVIGRRGADIAAEKAREHIAGYTIFNDFSARDEQAKAMRSLLGPGKGKDFDSGNALGPWLVTRDEIPEPYGLTMTARVNGAEWSRGTTSDMHWTFEDVIAHISRSETLRVGDVIASGTVGMGCGLEHGAFLQPGDVIELEVERIGVLRNSVAAHRREGGGYRQ